MQRCGAGSAAMPFVLDLYERIWEGAPLGVDDFVLCLDEKTSIQARRRKQPTLPPASDRSMRVEHEYFRSGAWTYQFRIPKSLVKARGYTIMKMSLGASLPLLAATGTNVAGGWISDQLTRPLGLKLAGYLSP